MEIRLVKMEEIKPYWRNPRRHVGMIDALIESIKKFGFKVPIVVDKENTIITGHARYTAVMQMKGTLTEYIETVKVQEPQLYENLMNINNGKVYIIQDAEISPQKAKEYRITDNKLNLMSEWDRDALESELRELESVIGFTPEEISSMMSNPSADYKFDDQNRINEIDKEITGRYGEETTEREGNRITVACPFCKKTFQIDKDVKY